MADALNPYYAPWVADGRPYELVAYGRDLVNTFKSHGFVVHHYPDEPHLKARTPEDHCPYSRTGWPLPSPYGKGHGIDVMPKPGTDARALAPIARRIIADKNAGHPGLVGLKYLNWTDEQGRVWHTKWQPDMVTTSSNDAGHLHLSCRSDCQARNLRTGGYDPITGGSDMSQDSDIIIAGMANGSLNVKLTNGADQIICATHWQVANDKKLDQILAGIAKLQRTLDALSQSGLTPEQIAALAALVSEKTAAAIKADSMAAVFATKRTV